MAIYQSTTVRRERSDTLEHRGAATTAAWAVAGKNELTGPIKSILSPLLRQDRVARGMTGIQKVAV